VAAEEKFLAGKFGAAFRAYCADVPRWLPRLGELRRAAVEGSFRWRRVIAKEYGTPFGWVSAVCLIAVYNLWRSGGGLDPNEEPAVLTLVAIMAFIALFWAVARLMKKTKLLVAD
jgi:hypothetical protein